MPGLLHILHSACMGVTAETVKRVTRVEQFVYLFLRETRFKLKNNYRGGVVVNNSGLFRLLVFAGNV